ncbi:MAG: ISL3 family transposase [Candidatus Latescibacterota bacterium]|nr:MAG: ISL3 family transposase [Candidatus Latescibacterota bacterium]
MTAQESGFDLLASFLRIQGFRAVDVELREWPTRQDPKRRVKVVVLEDERGFHVCPDCGRRHEEPWWRQTEPLRFRDCSMGDWETYLELYPCRVACCGGTRRERFPFEMPGHRMTRRFFERVAALCTRLPIYEVAAMAHLSWDTVCRIDKQAIELALGGRELSLDGLRWIGVDEVSRTGGHVYFTIVTDLESGRVVYIGDGKGDKGLRPFLERLGKRGRRRIRLTASDLGYLPLLAREFPKATHVLDRFHIVQWLNEALNTLRRRLFGGAPQDRAGRTLKVKKWLLLSGRERLEHKNKLVLARLMRLNRPLYRAYLLKEEMRGILHHPWRYFGALRRNLHAWYQSAVRCRLPEMQKVARRLKPYFDNIVAGYEQRLRMGLMESINSKIAALRGAARGYRDREYFKLKIFQRCSLPHNPWARIVL